MDSVFKLPVGAWYAEKQGQASVKVGRDSQNNLVVESACDSIQRRCWYLEEEITRIRNEWQEKEMQPPDIGSYRLAMVLEFTPADSRGGVLFNHHWNYHQQHLKRKQLWQ